MYVVLLTGGLASGKSVAADCLAELGATVLDSDLISKELQEREPVLSRILAEFGSDIKDDNNKFDRALLAKRAFATPDRAAKLAEICWPAVMDYLKTYIKNAGGKTFTTANVPNNNNSAQALIDAANRTPSAYNDVASCSDFARSLLVIQVPLLVEACAKYPEFLSLADEVITVLADKKLRLKRAIKRGMDERDATHRLALQASEADRVNISDTIFKNDGSLDEFTQQVHEWYKMRSKC